MDFYDVIIIGSGPAGLTAGIYAARAMLSTTLFTGMESGGMPGGQLMTTTGVENFPGFLSISGPELMQNMMKQAAECGVHSLEEDVISVDKDETGFIVSGRETKCHAKSVIVATGATAKRLYVPGTNEDELWNKGVSACAVCDGALPIFRNGVVFVIGGGDSAMEEALFLTRFAKEVVIVHRSDKFRASKVMLDRAMRHPNIRIMEFCELIEVRGKDKVEGVVLQNNMLKETVYLEANGVFFAIGHTPNTGFLNSLVDLEESGHIKVFTDSSIAHTSEPGIFVAGDVADYRYKQAITAAGQGCAAALEVIKYIELLAQNKES